MPIVANAPSQGLLNIVATLGGKWDRNIATCRCPIHLDQTPSLTLRQGDRGILVRCFAGCNPSDIRRALYNLGSQDFRDAKRAGAIDHNEMPNWNELAQNLWRKSSSIKNTIAVRYVQSRGIHFVHGFPRFLKFCRTKLSGSGELVTLPAMILPVAENGKVIAIQRVFLDPVTAHKANIPKAKLGLGAFHGGAIAYGGIPKGETLNLAEGFEDAASVRQFYNLDHCWAVGGIERYQLITIPPHIRNIVVWSQHGEPAARCVQNAMPHFTENGRTVQVNMPPPDVDWNDALVRRLL